MIRSCRSWNKQTPEMCFQLPELLIILATILFTDSVMMLNIQNTQLLNNEGISVTAILKEYFVL